jgi:hypothetical protein
MCSSCSVYVESVGSAIRPEQNSAPTPDPSRSISALGLTDNPLEMKSLGSSYVHTGVGVALMLPDLTAAACDRTQLAQTGCVASLLEDYYEWTFKEL